MAQASTSTRGTDTGDSGVEETESPSQDIRVGVLSPHNSKETKAILNAVRALGHQPIWIRDENVSSTIEAGEVRIQPDVDVLINRLLLTKSTSQLEDLQLVGLFETEIPVLNSSAAVHETIHKFRAGVRLTAAGLPVPDAFFARSPGTLDDWRRRNLDTAVHKRTIGTNGRQMSIVSTDESIRRIQKNAQSFVQEYLDNGDERPSDLRVYVVGDEIIGTMRRRAKSGEWRTNVALGGDTADMTDQLDSYPRRLALEAVDVLGLDLAGVDLMTVNGEWYVLEVNATAGFKGLFSATGISPAPHIARLAIQRAGGTVDQDRLEQLERTLDDRVPACKPDRRNGQGGEDVLGYTTRITVSGSSDAESCIAKSDTGAERTSIDTALAGRIGVGPMTGSTQVRSATGTGSETRPLVDVDLRIAGDWHAVTASVTDRGQMTYPLLLGRDVLSEYTIDINQRAEE